MFIKINNIDFSPYCSEYSVSNAANYKAQVSAGGNTVVDYINRKREINLKIIALDNITAKQLINITTGFEVKVEFLNPKTNLIETSNFIIPSVKNDYYTIQSDKTIVNSFSIKMIEL